MALFGDDQFGQAVNLFHAFLPFCIGGFIVGRRLFGYFVIILAVDEPDHIGVLLDRAGFAQIGELRAFIFALFNRAAKLGQRNNGHAEFLGERFKTTANFGDFVDAVVVRSAS